MSAKGVAKEGFGPHKIGFFLGFTPLLVGYRGKFLYVCFVNSLLWHRKVVAVVNFYISLYSLRVCIMFNVLDYSFCFWLFFQNFTVFNICFPLKLKPSVSRVPSRRGLHQFSNIPTASSQPTVNKPVKRCPLTDRSPKVARNYRSTKQQTNKQPPSTKVNNLRQQQTPRPYPLGTNS